MSGYTCSNCGAWVQYGTLHSCRTWPPPPPAPAPAPIPVYTFSPADLTPLVAVLERIADALEERNRCA